MSNFENSLAQLDQIEGGYNNLAHDTPTNFGITLATLRSWRRNPSLDAEDVKNMSRDEATAIYKAWYWNAMRLGEVVNDDVATVLFDQGVNRNLKDVIEEVQQLLNNKFGFFLTVDGKMGPKTLAALNSVRADEFIMEFVDDVQDTYIRILKKNPEKYIKSIGGWINRSQRFFKLWARK